MFITEIFKQRLHVNFLLTHAQLKYIFYIFYSIIEISSAEVVGLIIILQSRANNLMRKKIEEIKIIDENKRNFVSFFNTVRR